MLLSELEKDVQIGDFKIERRLGAGGMGIVFQARQISLNRSVALKILGNALTGSADIARFRREAQAAAKLDHAGIARLYFVGQTEGLCYLAMELIQGETLKTLISRLTTRPDAGSGIDAMLHSAPSNEIAETVTRFDVPDETVTYAPASGPTEPDGHPLPDLTRTLLASTPYIRRCCEIVREAAHVLDYAHKQGVVHRDIKPANLMLDRAGHLHLIDFGIARFFEDSTLTYSGQLVGTPMYMAPEQITGRYEPDPRTDIYALGLLLYELLTLRPPLTAPNREELLRRIVAKPLTPLSRVNQSVPRSLEAIVHAATAKNRDERYATAKAFAKDLKRFLSGQPMLATPYRYRFDQSEIRTNRPGWIIFASALLCSVGLLALFVGLVLFVGQVERHGRYDGPLVDINGVIFLVAAPIFFATAYGVGTAKRWGRVAGILLGPVGTALDLFVLRSLPGAPRIALWSIAGPLSVLLLMVAYKLTTGESRAWFSLAARIRTEYRSAQSSLRR